VKSSGKKKTRNCGKAFARKDWSDSIHVGFGYRPANAFLMLSNGAGSLNQISKALAP
jgi:hypothetical protein